MDKAYNVTNTLGQEGSIETSHGTLDFGSSGDFITHDEGLADEVADKYPHLLVTPHDEYHPLHPMRVTTLALPWGKYDERGRRLPD